ncbi:hypothetical protein IE81DRAFT_328502 [Ceraceosorus guamensis]|uniref:Uncharacterized protein n=1 Tax=Ceraceosorus guamensis TaxID=1522189 RepID=A0A316W4Q1_9BASI|nr:hypothetical protein IE81DRAFT_328502 [Ceraceosorus guamensis]PWN44937.1 hypothetical protein IE81DRAFT_328502 [Ceraceosorus guamensis]
MAKRSSQTNARAGAGASACKHYASGTQSIRAAVEKKKKKIWGKMRGSAEVPKGCADPTPGSTARTTLSVARPRSARLLPRKLLLALSRACLNPLASISQPPHAEKKQRAGHASARLKLVERRRRKSAATDREYNLRSQRIITNAATIKSDLQTAAATAWSLVVAVTFLLLLPHARIACTVLVTSPPASSVLGKVERMRALSRVSLGPCFPSRGRLKLLSDCHSVQLGSRNAETTHLASRVDALLQTFWHAPAFALLIDVSLLHRATLPSYVVQQIKSRRRATARQAKSGQVTIGSIMLGSKCIRPLIKRLALRDT